MDDVGCLCNIMITLVGGRAASRLRHGVVSRAAGPGRTSNATAMLEVDGMRMSCRETDPQREKPDRLNEQMGDHPDRPGEVWRLDTSRSSADLESASHSNDVEK